MDQNELFRKICFLKCNCDQNKNLAESRLNTRISLSLQKSSYGNIFGLLGEAGRGV